MQLSKMAKYLSATLWLIILSACLSSHPPANMERSKTIPLSRLLALFPAQNAVQEQLLVRALMDLPQDSLQNVIHYFAREPHPLTLKAQYAIHALALNFKRLGQPQQKKLVNLFNDALPRLTDAQQQQFLIEQMQWSGDDRFAPVLKPYYFSQVLQQPVLRALKQLKGPACNQTILQLLGQANDASLQPLIELCAGKNLKGSAPFLKKLASAERPEIKKEALLALARLGDPLVLAQARQQFETALPFISSLIATGKPQQAKGLIDHWLKRSATLTCEQFTQLLTLARDLDEPRAIEHAFRQWAAPNTTAECRSAILLTVSTWNDSLLALTFGKILDEERANLKSEIIAFFARQKNRFVFSQILRLLGQQNSDSLTLQAAIQAQAYYRNPAAVPVLFDELNTHPQNSDLVLNTLNHFAPQEYQTHLIEVYGTATLQTKKAIIRFAARRQITALNPAIIRELQGEHRELRLLVWKNLTHFSGQEALNDLLTVAFNVQDESEQNQAFKGLARMVKERNLQRSLLKLLQDQWPQAEQQTRLAILNLCRNMGGKAFFKFVEMAGADRSAELRQAARTTLLKWPDDAALNALLLFIRDSRDQAQKILALRQAVQIIQNSGMAAERALAVLKTLLSLAERTAEKERVVSVMGLFPSFETVKTLSALSSDATLGASAFNALTRIMQSLEPSPSSEVRQAYLALIAAHASPQALSAIQELRSLNKPPEGFEALFNGRDLSGWQAVAFDPLKAKTLPPRKRDSLQQAADAEMRKHWKVQNGILMFDGNGYLSLQTRRAFRNFELLIDWKIEKFGDSGIYLRGCPQVQIWDPQQWHIGSGGLYNNQHHASQPLTTADKPAGQWNHFRIILKGDRVTVYLNDVLVVDQVVLENYWERDQPLYPIGPIELQAHNSPLYFKNIFIKELPDEPPLFKGPLFNGKNLDGWQVIGNTPDSWGVKDSILYTTGQGGGWLSTTREFGDFKLSLEFRVPAGGNSGLFIRAPHQGDPAYTGMEIQILDDYAPKYAHLKPWQYTGSIYGVQAPAQRVSRSAGHWQKMVVTCRGPQIEVQLNGQVINKANVIQYMHLERSHPGLIRRKGFIGLQNHSSVVEFRNIYLEEL